MDNDSKRRLRHMLQEEDNNIDLGEYGLGSVRTHHEYELYAGINFKNRRLHPSTLKGINPPINDISLWYEVEEKKYDVTVNIPIFSRQNKFIYVAIEDDQGNVLFRQDVINPEQRSIDISFITSSTPKKSIVWPMDINNEWYDRTDILL